MSKTPETRPTGATATPGSTTEGPDAHGTAEASRLNVNINARTAEELRRVARRSGITYTEAVRRAVEVLAFLTDERDAGRALQIYDPERDVTRELITL